MAFGKFFYLWVCVLLRLVDNDHKVVIGERGGQRVGCFCSLPICMGVWLTFSNGKFLGKRSIFKKYNKRSR